MSVVDEVMGVVFAKPETTIEEAQVEVIKRTGQYVDRSEVAKQMRELEKAGFGVMKLGRRGHATRFVLTPQNGGGEEEFTTTERHALKELAKAWALSKKQS